MTIRYLSTRGGAAGKSFTDVLLEGLAPDGGLYVPDQWPQLDIEKLGGLSYRDIAFEVMKPFVGGDIPDADLKDIIDRTYGKNFRHADIAPLVKIGEDQWILELFHGPTIAFKDYALQLVGQLFDYVLKKKKTSVTIVGATSGDTGSAAIEGVRGCDHVRIFILHPEGRTSEVQRRQMTSVIAPNVHNIALNGNFDDCQNAVKALFADTAFRDEMNLSAVNSINFARIMAQIVYYFTAAIALGASADRKISFAVPTGNFGNVYAAYCAKQMGLPIERLIIGSNRNDILTRFFETAEMKATSVEPSLSPSMDIQISSNFERYLFDLLGRDAGAVREKMDAFKKTGSFALDDKDITRARALFSAYRTTDEQTLETMASCYRDKGYLCDPHTAVGLRAGKLAAQNLSGPLIVLACAHPAKFPDAVKKAVKQHSPLPEHLADLFDREEKYTALPNDLAALKDFIRQHRA